MMEWSDLLPYYEELSARNRFPFHSSKLFNEYTYLIQLCNGEKFTINPKVLDFGYNLLGEEQIKTLTLKSTLSLSDVRINCTRIDYPEVYGFGYNSEGAMGIGSLESYSILKPTGVDIDNVAGISSSRYSTFFLKKMGHSGLQEKILKAAWESDV